MPLIKAWLSVKILFTVLCNTWNVTWNDQKPKDSSCTFIKILLSHLHRYHIAQLQNIATLAISPTPQIQNFTNSPFVFSLDWQSHLVFFVFFCFFLLFFEIGRIYEWIIITIVSNIAVLLSQNVIFFGYLTPNSHGVNKKTSPGASLNLLPLITGFHHICLLFYKK